jgi:hypothetical protein
MVQYGIQHTSLIIENNTLKYIILWYYEYVL